MTRKVRTVDESLRLRRMADLVRGCTRVLDVGSAQLPNPFLRNPEVVGLDLEAPSVTSAPYSRWVQSDAMGLPEPFGEQSFDAVLAGEILEHVERPIDLLRALGSVLQSGGKLVLSTPNPNCFIERVLTWKLSRSHFYTKEHVCLYPQRWLIRMLEIAGFADVRLYSGGVPVPVAGLVPFPRPWCYQTIASGIRQ